MVFCRKFGKDDEAPGLAVVSGRGEGGSVENIPDNRIRHRVRFEAAAHGNSVSHNRPGSTGQNQDPSKVFPGKRMAGHMGDVKRTVQNLEIVRIDAERQLLMIKGALPGSKGGNVVVSPTVRVKL